MGKKYTMFSNNKNNKYVIDFTLNKQLTAGPKARTDINTILKKRNYNIIMLVFSRKKPITSIKNIFSILYKIPNRSNVIVQYPIGNIYSSFILLSLLQIKRCSISILIHDIESLRSKGRLSYIEKCCYEKGKLVITHTPRMKDYLSSILKRPQLSILHVFDYLVDNMPTTTDTRENNIGFAGNLFKSPFIQKLKEINCDFILFGKYNSAITNIFTNGIHYGGCFQQNDLSCLNFDWGLVWDGDDIHSCNGKIGKYLQYNAPHKLSLYIAAEIPVIVWKESAEKDFVIQHKIGIAVDSLSELANIIPNIDDMTYTNFKKNIQQLSKEVRNGRMLMNVLDL